MQPAYFKKWTATNCDVPILACSHADPAGNQRGFRMVVPLMGASEINIKAGKAEHSCGHKMQSTMTCMAARRLILSGRVRICCVRAAVVPTCS